MSAREDRDCFPGQLAEVAQSHGKIYAHGYRSGYASGLKKALARAERELAVIEADLDVSLAQAREAYWRCQDAGDRQYAKFSEILELRCLLREAE